LSGSKKSKERGTEKTQRPPQDTLQPKKKESVDKDSIKRLSPRGPLTEGETKNWRGRRNHVRSLSESRKRSDKETGGRARRKTPKDVKRKLPEKREGTIRGARLLTSNAKKKENPQSNEKGQKGPKEPRNNTRNHPLGNAFREARSKTLNQMGWEQCGYNTFSLLLEKKERKNRKIKNS